MADRSTNSTAKPTRTIPPQLEAAAERRARGMSWEAAAKELGRNEKTLRDWAKKFPEAWRAALARCEVQIASEAKAESVLTLRKQLRSDDEKIARDAAAELIRYATTKRRTASRKSGRSRQFTSEIAAIAEFVGGLTDEETTALLRELRSADPLRTDDPGADARPKTTACTLAQ